MKYLILFLLVPISSFSQNKGASPIAGSQEPTAIKSTYAVIIGISDYQDKDIPDLRYADKDAEAFANFLRSPAGGSLDGDHLQVLTNTRATAGRIAEALDALIEKAKKDDQVIIYFSGHGDVEGKKLTQPGFLLCWDAPSRVYMGGGTYSLSFLQEVVSTLSVTNQAKVVVITDACHAGKLAGSQIGGAQLTTANLAKQYANEIKILSCQPNEFSLEGPQWGGGRGVFSYHLVEGLFGFADRNSDGQITLGEIDRYLEDHVTVEAAPQSQVPILLGNKTDRLATVNASILADLKKNKTADMAVFASMDSRGLEDDVLAELDSGIIKKYFAFKKAVAEKRFLPDALSPNPQPSADELYASLSAEPGLAPLHGFMKRNYAAALQDDAQQVLNTSLKSGLTSEVLSDAKAAIIYRNYPAYLERAAELLGSGHYMYTALKARKHYFEGIIQTAKRDKKQQFFQALHWQADMPHAYAVLIELYPPEQADSAEYYAGKAMQIAPAWVKPYIHLSKYYRNANQPVKAEELLNRALQLDSNSILVWFHMASFFEKQEQYATAEHWYLKAIAGSGDDICFPCAHNQLGVVYWDTRRYAEAEQQFKKAIQLDSTFANAYYNLGIVYANTRRYSDAEQQYKKAIQFDSTFAFPYNGLGAIYCDIFKRYDEAEQLFKKAVQLDSTFVNAYCNLALLQCLQNKTEAAFGYLEKALKYPFNYYDNLQQDSSFALLREQKDRWEALLQYAIVKDTTDAQAWNKLGQVYIRARNYASAEVAMRKAVALDATSAPFRSNLGFVYLNLGRYPEAEVVLKKAIALDSAFANARKHLGMVCFKTNRPEEAKQSFLKAIALNPNYVPAYLGMAYLLHSEGKTEEALGYVEQAISKGSTFEQLESDKDLVQLRATQEWKTLINKHFPEKSNR